MRVYFACIRGDWSFEGYLVESDYHEQAGIKERIERDNGPGSFFVVDLPAPPNAPIPDCRAYRCEHVIQEQVMHCLVPDCSNRQALCNWRPDHKGGQS